MSTLHLKIAKLTAATDAEHIEKALESVSGVHSVTLNPAANEAIVEHDGADQDALTTAVKQQGYVAVID